MGSKEGHESKLNKKPNLENEKSIHIDVLNLKMKKDEIVGEDLIW